MEDEGIYGPFGFYGYTFQLKILLKALLAEHLCDGIDDDVWDLPCIRSEIAHEWPEEISRAVLGVFHRAAEGKDFATLVEWLRYVSPTDQRFITLCRENMVLASDGMLKDFLDVVENDEAVMAELERRKREREDYEFSVYGF